MPVTNRNGEERNGREKGYVAVVVALMLPVLVGFIALGVDMGVLYSARTQAQRAADAAALAGAFYFVLNPNASVSDIKERAIRTAAINRVMGDSVVINAADVVVDETNRLVTVTVARTQERGNPVSTYFARTMGIDTADVQVSASAEASDRARGADCLKPWIIPSTMLSEEEPCDACALGETLVTSEPTVNTSFVTPFYGGKSHMFKPQTPQSALRPSNFYAVEIDCTGANCYEEAIATCTDTFVSCGSRLRVENGNMVGPTVSGVDQLTGPTPDFFHAIAEYGPEHLDTSAQLVLAPVWDACYSNDFSGPGACPAENVPTGSGAEFTIEAFALIFVEGIGTMTETDGKGKATSSEAVEGKLIQVFPCNAVDDGTNLSGPFSVPVRLIRNPTE